MKTRPLALATCGLVLALASPVIARAETATNPDAPSASPPSPVVLTGEVGGGQTKPSPTTGQSAFFYEKAKARFSPLRRLELAPTFRATEDLARAPDPGSQYATGGDLVLYLGLDGTYDVSKHVDLTVGANGSPTSTRDVGTSIAATRPNGTTGDVDAQVRTRSDSVGGLVELGYDSFDEDVDHDVDVAVDLAAAVTRFGTEQTVAAPDFAAARLGTKSDALLQGRLGVASTLTFGSTDVGLDAAYFVYDKKNPGDVGLFTQSGAAGVTTSFGAGLPMLPPRWTLQPELGQRLGRVSIVAYYQYAALAVEDATGHTVGGRLQLAIGNVKLFATGSYRADVFSDETAATWSAGAGMSIKL